MLHFKVKEILLQSGQRYPAKWLQKVCTFSQPKSFKIVHNMQRSINLDDFSKLCETLNCTPNELMYWEETARSSVPATHPCRTQLTPPDKNADWAFVFKHLTQDQIRDLHQQAVSVIGKKKG